MMKLLASIAVLLCFAPASALAWGAEGHQVVAEIAYRRLSPAARVQVLRLLDAAPLQQTPECPVRTLEDAAEWPDCVRGSDPRFTYLTRDHFEDLPLCRQAGSRPVCPDGQCVVAAVARSYRALADRRRSDVERLQALEELSHFVGDLHQPLHVADNGDVGGNAVRVLLPGRRYPTNLHAAWDRDLVTAAVGYDRGAAVDRLEGLIAAHGSGWSAGTPDEWAREAHAIAVANAYGAPPSPPTCGEPAPFQQLTREYVEQAAPAVRLQLAKAGVRLAKLLNDALR